jgi:amino acid transporter
MNELAAALVAYFIVLLVIAVGAYYLFYIRPGSSFVLGVLVGLIVMYALYPLSSLSKTKADWLVGAYAIITIISLVILLFYIIIMAFWNKYKCPGDPNDCPF